LINHGFEQYFTSDKCLRPHTLASHPPLPSYALTLTFGLGPNIAFRISGALF